MFGLFKKRPQPMPPVDVPDLHFKSVAAAFEYACAYFDNNLAGWAPVPAVVLSVSEKNSCAVKIANASDSSIPVGLNVDYFQTGDIQFISVRTDALDGVGRLEVGDLVSFFRPDEFKAMPILMGFINGRLLPQYSMRHQGWKLAGAR